MHWNNRQKLKIIHTYSGQSDLYTLNEGNRNIVVYILQMLCDYLVWPARPLPSLRIQRRGGVGIAGQTSNYYNMIKDQDLILLPTTCMYVF